MTRILGVRQARLASAMPAMLFWAGFMLLAFGFVGNALWREVALSPTLLLGKLALASVAAAYVLGRLLHCRFATAMLAVWLIALACFAGLSASITIVLIAAAAMAIGSRFVPADWRGRAVLSVLAGLALMVGVVGWTLPFHIDHLRVVYVAGLVVLIAWRSRELAAMLRPLPTAWSSAVAVAPVAAGLAMIALGVVSTSAWLPTVLFDDLAYHLGLPAQLAKLGYYQMNAATNVWALAGWSADVLQGIAQVTAGLESRGAVDMLWFTLSAILMWQLCAELELKPALRWLALALLAAVPALVYTLFSMQTEGPTIAVMLGFALLIQRSRVAESRLLVVIAMLFGLLLGLKVSNLWFALPLTAWCLWQWRGRLPWRTLPRALLFALIVAGSSYVYAYALTGNPVLPVFNGFFHSPFFSQTDLYDSRWHSGFGWDIVWRVVFHAAEFMEGGNAPASFALIGLGGCFFVALVRTRSRGLALVAAVAFLLPLSTIQYLRYATPGLALLIPAVLCGLPSDYGSSRHQQVRAGLLWALVLMNLVFVSSICWQLRGGALHTLLTLGDQGVSNQFAPTRRIAQVIRNRYGEAARTLMLDPAQPFAAELAGNAFANIWYDPQLHALLNQRPTGDVAAKWAQAIELTGANLVVTRSGGSLPPGLWSALEADGAELVYMVHGLDLWELHRGQAGAARIVANDGIAVIFDSVAAPLRRTLVHGELELACNPRQAMRGHIVVGWRVTEISGRQRQRYGWVLCQPDGRAHSVWDSIARSRVTAFTAQVQPDPVMDMGLRLLSSRASFRNDLTAQRDLARHLRHQIEFWKKPKHRVDTAP